MQIYIHRNNQQLGPFTEAEIKAQFASGTISLQDHVWWQGQANWIPLGESPLMAPGFSAAPETSTVPAGTLLPTSKLAIWALVCGCLSLFCGLLASIPAIILGHLGLSEIKKNPAVQGRGMAMTGMILGYIFTTLIILYLITIVVFLAMGQQVNGIFKTINAQLKAAEITNSADQSATNSDQTTNTPDQSTPAPTTTNTPDQSTNSAPATTNSADSSTNAPTTSTNSAPMSQ